MYVERGGELSQAVVTSAMFKCKTVWNKLAPLARASSTLCLQNARKSGKLAAAESVALWITCKLSSAPVSLQSSRNAFDVCTATLNTRGNAWIR